MTLSFVRLRLGCSAAILLLGCVWVCSGCMQAYENPEALLNEALDAFESRHRTVEAEQAGDVIIRSLGTDWHPLRDIRQFRSGIEEVNYDQEQSDSKSIVLSLKLNPKTAKVLLTAQLLAELSHIDQQQELLASHAAGDPDQQVITAISRRVQEAQAELTQMLSQVHVEAKVWLWIKQGSPLPYRMRWDNRIQALNGDEALETWSQYYRITG